MKKILCIILITLCTFCLFARDRHVTSSEAGHQVEDLLDDGLYENRDQILTIVPVLTPEDISILYSKNKTSALSDSLVNGLLGFGIGSFVTGDKKGGFIQLGLEGGGIVIGTISIGYFIASSASSILGAIFGNKDKNSETIMGASIIGMVGGIGAFAAGRIYGIVRGIKYPKQYNKDLQETLYGVSESAPQLSIAPVFAPTGLGFGVGVKF